MELELRDLWRAERLNECLIAEDLRELGRIRCNAFLGKVADENLVIHRLGLCLRAIGLVDEEGRLFVRARENEDAVSANALMAIRKQADRCRSRHDAHRASIQNHIFFLGRRIILDLHHVGRLRFNFCA